MYIHVVADPRDQRLRAIAELIRSQRLASQEELAECLAGLGFKVTQATISRDLEQLEAVKVRRNGQVAYALPGQFDGAATAGPRLETVVRDWVHSVQPAGNLGVIKTPPGSAHLVGVALDRADLPRVVGTICGDDTLFVALETPAQATALAAALPEAR
jgi:transcriptional regulator of arginine metabolism